MVRAETPRGTNPLALTATHKRRIRKLAAYLRENVTPEHFDITSWWRDHRTGWPICPEDLTGSPRKVAEKLVKDCGTAACVAGWAALVFPNDIPPNTYNIAERAANFLGLSYAARKALFTPPGTGSTSAKRLYTVKRAVETLERLADTGTVQWFKTHKPVPA